MNLILHTPRGIVVEQNAKHFPDDHVWQRHCEKMARMVHDCHDCGRTKYIDDVFECCEESEEQ